MPQAKILTLCLGSIATGAVMMMVLMIGAHIIAGITRAWMMKLYLVFLALASIMGVVGAMVILFCSLSGIK